MCYYKHLKPTGEELHSRAVWQKGSFIGYIARKIGKDKSSVCHKVEKTERYKRFSACAAPKEGASPLTAGKSREGGIRPCARSSWRSVGPPSPKQAGNICAGRGSESAARGLRPKLC
ncbi:MAG: hypothetical protein DUD39_11925 [Coriobacteriaceae bacterium]|uniref:hypothetical protein n=1 Tax=Atopobium sp. oral taxon 416 TaxID=712157 RepID=UPI000FF5BE6F|nr:hypothetical protein [Atopobium sp. oral taxon 416]QUC02562.1 hypothetical protein J4859_11010 [Atopobium sp. oral taxon 416]RRF97997.1 MAG: hypothetical protein DUD39_11925 [Coriobacteriaceae bacterium]